MIFAAIAVVVLVFAGLAALPLFLPAETIRTELVARIEAATGRPTRIDGPVSFSVIPTARLSAEGIGIAGLASDSEAFSVESVSFGLSLLPLITGNIEIYGVTIMRPTVLIEIDESGQTNWTVRDATAEAAPGTIEDMISTDRPEGQSAPQDTLAVLERLSIGRVRIADGTLIWRNGGREERVDDIDLDIRVPRLDGAGNIEGNFTRLGIRQSLELQVGERPDPNRLESIPINFTLSSDGGEIVVIGTAMSGETLFDGSAETEGKSLAEFAKVAGIELPNMPVFGAFNTSTRLNASSSEVRIDQFSVDLGGLKARGGAVVRLDRARPGIGLKVAADTIDTALFVTQGKTTDGGNAATSAPDPTSAPSPASEEIDFSALSLFDANIDISAQEILIGAVPVTGFGVDAQILNGVLQANVRSASVNGAPASGAIAVDTSAEVPEIKGNAKVAGLDAAGLVALAGMDLPIDAGAVGVDIAFATRGRTEGQLVENLDGSGRVSLADGRVSGLDVADLVGGDQAANEVGDIDLAAQFSSLAAPIDAEGGFTWRGERFTVAGRGNPRALAAAGTTAVSLDAKSQRVSFGFNGDASAAGLGNGTARLSTPSLRNLLAWIGQPMAPGGGLGAFSINGAITLGEDAFSFENAEFALDGSEGVGTGKLSFGGKPKVTAGLSMKRLDVTPYLIASGRSGTGGAEVREAPAGPSNTASGWSDAPIGFDGLQAIDANLNLKADEIIADQIKIGPSRLTATIASGKLTAELSEMALYSGIGVGTLSVDGASSTPSLEAFFRLDDIEALPFLRDATGFSRVEGTGSFSFDLRSAGGSEAALMAALNGKGAMNFRNGAIRGIDIPRMVRSLSIETLLGWQQSGDAKTEFTQLSGTYTIENGILTNSDLNLIGPLLRVTGAGTVDIPKRTLAYRVDPKIVASLDGQGSTQDLEGFAVPIRIEGSWNRPRIYPEIDGILQNPQQALDQLRKLGSGLFGAAGSSASGRQPAGSAGKSVEDRINEELSKGLDKLFGGGTRRSNTPQPERLPPAAATTPPSQGAVAPAMQQPREQLPPEQPPSEQQPAEQQSAEPQAPAQQAVEQEQPVEQQPNAASPLDLLLGQPPAGETEAGEAPSAGQTPPGDNADSGAPQPSIDQPVDLLKSILGQ